jgi:hypothetical protein
LHPLRINVIYTIPPCGLSAKGCFYSDPVLILTPFDGHCVCWENYFASLKHKASERCGTQPERKVRWTACIDPYESPEAKA